MIVMTGLPRSGSTYLASMLSLHPDIHVTMTSSLPDLVSNIRSTWTSLDGFRAEGLENVKPHIMAGVKGLIDGFHGHYKKKVVISKSRNWLYQLDILQTIYPKVINICPIRDPKDIIASFEVLYSKNLWTAPFTGNTVKERAEHLMNTILGNPLRKICDSPWDNLFVPYNAIVNNPIETCTMLFAKMGIKPIQIDLLDLQERDWSRDVDVWGLPLHKLGAPKIASSWKDWLTEDLAKWVDSQHTLGPLCMGSVE